MRSLNILNLIVKKNGLNSAIDLQEIMRKKSYLEEEVSHLCGLENIDKQKNK